MRRRVHIGLVKSAPEPAAPQSAEGSIPGRGPIRLPSVQPAPETAPPVLASRDIIEPGRARVNDRQRVVAFERAMAPHVRAAYGLARWLLGNTDDAEDATQDAYVRAFRHFSGYSGENARAWILAIVRRCCYSTLAQKRGAHAGLFDEEQHSEAPVSPLHGQPPEGPERAILRADDARLLNDAVAALPVEQRETFVLRELEGLSYKEIADVAGIPIGTVMSRLSRARAQLQRALRASGGERP